MKKLIFILFFLSAFATNTLEAKNLPPYSRVTFSVFYTSLLPYGEWIEIDYGVYAWRPIKISYGWAPYLIGRWVWTPYGWYWDSFEPFGWAVYHYGRWYYDDYYGWIWIPDYEWAPAWVEWRYNDYYIGWAPLPPYARFSATIGIRFTVNWHSPHYYWHFVPVRYFCGYEVHRFVVPAKHRYVIYRDSRYSIDYRVDGDRIINRGIDRNFIERRGGRVIETRIQETTRLRDLSSDRSPERVTIYRPDERDFNQRTDYSFKKPERRLNLETDKIAVTREKITTREIERNKKEVLNQRREIVIERPETRNNRNKDQGRKIQDRAPRNFDNERNRSIYTRERQGRLIENHSNPNKQEDVKRTRTRDRKTDFQEYNKYERKSPDVERRNHDYSRETPNPELRRNMNLLRDSNRRSEEKSDNPDSNLKRQR